MIYVTVARLPAVSIATDSATWRAWNLTVDGCEHFDFTVWVCLSAICLWRRSELSWSDLELSGQFVEGDGTERERERNKAVVGTYCTYARLICSTLWTSLQMRIHQISLRNQCRTAQKTCKTCFPSSRKCVINHVEIKVKGKALTLS